MGDPQVRANWPKFIVSCAKRLKNADGAPFADALSPELRREIREAGRLTWQDAQFRDLIKNIGLQDYWRRSGIVPDFQSR